MKILAYVLALGHYLNDFFTHITWVTSHVTNTFNPSNIITFLKQFGKRMAISLILAIGINILA